MSDIRGELARVSEAYARPTLSLLHKKHAPVIVAIFRSCFSRDLAPVATDRLHALVADQISELAQAGFEVPQGTGKDLCRAWMHEQFLRRTTTDDGEEVYELTASTVDALGVVTSLTRQRQMLGEHRVNTILNAVRRFNAEVNPDRQARIEILESEVATRIRELDRLRAGGDMPPADPDALIEGFVNLMGLVEGLPGDFQRVREAFGNMRRDIIARLRSEEELTDVLSGYLHGSSDLLVSTPEGRAFAGAVALLTNEGLISDLRRDLTALLDHPQATGLLNPAERRHLRGTLEVVTHGVTEVLTERSRLTGTLRQRIVHHDVAADRALDATLRSIENELATWMTTAGPRAVIDVEVLPSRLEVDHLRTRLYDPRDEVPPPRLQQVDDLDDELSMERLRQQGGPSLLEYRSLLSEAFTSAHPPTSLGEFFGRLRPDLRRPVEVFGLVHLAASVGALPDTGETEIYTTVRPDGTTREFVLPRISISSAQARALRDATTPVAPASTIPSEVTA